LCGESRADRKGSRAFFCLLTGEDRGAIAVVRVWGPGAIDLVKEVFRPSGTADLGQSRLGRLRLGRIGDGLGDEVVGAVLETAIPAVELQCHGGTAAVSLVQEALERAGAQRSQRWELAGFDYPSGDLLAADALDDLSKAPTVQTAEILLDQAQGALRAEIALLANLVETDTLRGLAGLGAIIERGAVGLRLLSGWKVVIVGRPNVGKSRLLNALCGFHRAIVNESPGTTRDVVAFQTAFGGWPVELADTAGLRATEDAIEQLGMKRTRQELAAADLVVLVLDGSEGLRPIDRQLMAATEGALVIANKADLPAAWRAPDGSLGIEVLTVSAKRGDGVDELVGMIGKRLVPSPPRPREAVPFRCDQLEALRAARDHLVAGRTTAASARLKSMIGVSHGAIEEGRRRHSPRSNTGPGDDQGLSSAGG
jgi:tRNA modification GTPase